MARPRLAERDSIRTERISLALSPVLYSGIKALADIQEVSRHENVFVSIKKRTGRDIVLRRRPCKTSLSLEALVVDNGIPRIYAWGVCQVKHIEGDIWELRPLKDRIFFVAWFNESFVLLHQFRKETQKTPPREIEKARREYADLKERGLG